MAPSQTHEGDPLIVGYPTHVLNPVDGTPLLLLLPSRRGRHNHHHAGTFSSSSSSSFSSSSYFFFVFFLFFCLAGSAAFLMWPRTIEMSEVGMNLGKIHFDVKKKDKDSLIPQVFLDMSLDLSLQARNPNFFGVTYDTLEVKILFEGDELGRMRSNGVVLEPLSTSNVNATLDLNGYQITSNVLKLLVDVASGTLPVQTVTTFDGHISMLFFPLPLQGMVSCDMLINLQDQAVVSQVCDI